MTRSFTVVICYSKRPGLIIDRDLGVGGKKFANFWNFSKSRFVHERPKLFSSDEIG